MFGVKANGGSNPSTTASEPAGCLALCEPRRVSCTECPPGKFGGHRVSTHAFVMRCIKCLNQTTSTFRGVPYLLIGESVINERIRSLLGMIVPEQAGGGRLLERDL